MGSLPGPGILRNSFGGIPTSLSERKSEIMTEMQKKEKLQKLNEEIDSVNAKIAKLLVHRDRLDHRFRELQNSETKEVKTPTEAEKEEQSRKDKKAFADLTLQRAEQAKLGPGVARALRKMTLE